MTPFADARYMDVALALGRAGLGTTAPNPSVGCVIVSGGRIVGTGTTARGGRPHAETVALMAAGPAARGATAYVTLEPCSHTGQTPPCADALITAGVSRLVIACRDPFPSVDGRGVDRLKAAGLEVEVGLRGAEAESLHAGFFKRLRSGLPLAAIDGETLGYDAVLPDWLNEPVRDVLARCAADGMTRVRARPGSQAAEALRAAHLADFDVESVTTSR